MGLDERQGLQAAAGRGMTRPHRDERLRQVGLMLGAQKLIDTPHEGEDSGGSP